MCRTQTGQGPKFHILLFSDTTEGKNTMATLMPDPTFYPSPKMAMQAPEEKLAYVVLLNPDGNARPDALAVMDVDPDSSTYQQVVGRVELGMGDEVHHFG